MVKSGRILAVPKVEPAEFSGVRKRRGKYVSTMFSSHIRKLLFVSRGKNRFGADRFTLRCLLEMPHSSWIHNS